MAEAWFPAVGKRGVGWRQRCAEDLAVLPDENAFEERLVEDASLEWRASDVGRLRRARSGKHFSERCADVSGLSVRFAQKVSGVLLLRAEALLLAGENFVGHQALVLQLHQARLVVFEFPDGPRVALDVADDDG